MVELLVDDDCELPQVLQIEGGIRIRVPTIISYDEIIKEIGSALTPAQTRVLFEIWCNDEAHRKYKTTPNGYLVTLRGFTTDWKIEGRTTFSGQPRRER